MSQQIIKIVWEATNEIRKIQVDEDKWLDGVIEKVRDLFGVCKIGADEEPNIRLWYIDNHGDAIYVSTSEELRIGLRSGLRSELVLFGSLLQRNSSSDQSGSNQSERYETKISRERQVIKRYYSGKVQIPNEDEKENPFLNFRGMNRKFHGLCEMFGNRNSNEQFGLNNERQKMFDGKNLWKGIVDSIGRFTGKGSIESERMIQSFIQKILQSHSQFGRQEDQSQRQSNETNQKSESQSESQSSEKKKEREKTKDEQLLWNTMFEDFGLEAERQGSQKQEKEKEKDNKQQQSDEHRQNNNSEYEYPQMWHQFGDMALQFLNQMNKNRSNGFEQQNLRCSQDQIGQHDRTEDFLAWEGIRQQQIQTQTQTQHQQQSSSSSSSSTSIPIEFAKGSSVEGQTGSEDKVEEKKE
ncbi:MAG: hypothetical protein EZS28_003800 [Streblomastix strix]|uniref:AXH domain-containing protein n=1 Tax=Streblomastix strix TaxID=222440 RepID=A0A5J4X0U1_9EUKA|nr:MAG: hypothetical protein EZS28_003800 [Streblomastix strix]